MAGLLEGKVVVITGAASGVGHAAVQIFAAHGARVVAADIDAEGAQAAAAKACAAGGQATGVGCDVGDEAAVESAVQLAVSTYGRLDVMYNNAGLTVSNTPGRGMKQITDTTAADIAKVEAVNIHGVIHGCKSAVRQFELQGGGGVIVNTASVAGLIGYGGVLYGATKGAIVSLTRALAIESAPKNIRVNAVCPAGMVTRFAGQDPEGANGEAMRERVGKAHPLGRAIAPEDCAHAALFLASDLACNITGVNLPVDGGLTAGIPLRKG